MEAEPLRTGREADAASLARLKPIAILAPVLLFLAWDYFAHYVLARTGVPGHLLLLLTAAAVSAGAAAFTVALFRVIESLQRRLLQQNRALASQAQALEVLYEIGTALSALRDVQSTKEIAVRRARQLFGADAGGLAVLHEPRGIVRWELLVGAASRSKNFEVAVGECLGGRVIASGEPLVIEDVTEGAGEADLQYPLLARERLRAALTVPVRISGRPIGALMVAYLEPRRFDLAEVRLAMGLANQVAVAIDNARLHDRLNSLSILEERERVARELHDGLAQLIGHMTARIAAAERHLARGRQSSARQQLNQLRLVAEEAYDDVRHTILGLRTRPEEERGLLRALERYAQRFSEREGVTLRLRTRGEVDRLMLAPQVEVQAIRIIQEAVNNVRKHAQAATAWVEVGCEGPWAEIIVRDEGRGFLPSAVGGDGRHFGLDMMRERAESVGGRLSVHTAPGQGTTVNVRLPLDEEP